MRIHKCVEPYVLRYYPAFWNAFKEMRDYRTYRFILGTIKAGYLDLAMVYVDRWKTYLVEFVRGTGKVNDRLKCKLILDNKRWILNFVKILF